MIRGLMMGAAASRPKSAPAGSDPPWSTVFLLAHLNTPVGNLYPGDVVDSSSYARTIGIGNVSGSASGKFGGGIVFTYNNGPALYTTTGTGAAIGVGDFTVEWWVKSTYVPPITSNRPPRIFSAVANDTSNSLTIWVSRGDSWDGLAGSISLALPTGGGVVVSTGVPVADGMWHHVAVSRVSGTSRIFLDGVLKQSAADTTNYSQWATSGFYITTGDYPAGSSTSSTNSTFYSATVDEVRMCRYGLYSANFTPPSAAFPNA